MKDEERYLAACHAMQSGVAMSEQYDPKQFEPKHLRVGVNSALVETSALTELLIEKRVFTEDEFGAALADGMQRAADDYANQLSEILGTRVTLG